jgi:SET domain-containing protein
MILSERTRTICERQEPKEGLTYSLDIRPSPISGRGVFALRSFARADVLYIAPNPIVLPFAAKGTVQRSRHENVADPTILRWVNHSCKPNVRVEFDDGQVSLTAVRIVQRGDELMCDYCATEDYMPIPFLCACGKCAHRMIRGRQR